MKVHRRTVLLRLRLLPHVAIATAVALLTSSPARQAIAQEECRCFHFDGETEVSGHAFDMQFTNHCGKVVTVYYWRQAGKAQDGNREIFWAEPGTYKSRCNGTRDWICTPIVNMEFICPQFSSRSNVNSSGFLSGKPNRQNDKNGDVEKRNGGNKAPTQQDVAKDAKEIETKREAERKAEEKEVRDLQAAVEANTSAVKKQILDDLRKKQQKINAATGSYSDQLNEVARAAAIRQRQWHQQQEANYIPPGWIRCSCPEYHSYAGKLVNGVRYHQQNVGDCD
jgi:hypothetical protein